MVCCRCSLIPMGWFKGNSGLATAWIPPGAWWFPRKKNMFKATFGALGIWRLDITWKSIIWMVSYIVSYGFLWKTCFPWVSMGFLFFSAWYQPIDPLTLTFRGVSSGGVRPPWASPHGVGHLKGGESGENGQVNCWCWWWMSTYVYIYIYSHNIT